jgi:hypothetical protein
MWYSIKADQLGPSTKKCAETQVVLVNQHQRVPCATAAQRHRNSRRSKARIQNPVRGNETDWQSGHLAAGDRFAAHSSWWARIVQRHTDNIASQGAADSCDYSKTSIERNSQCGIEVKYCGTFRIRAAEGRRSQINLQSCHAVCRT